MAEPRNYGYEAVRVDTRGAAEFLGYLDQTSERLQRAIQLALNTVGRSTRTKIWRDIRDQINLKPSYINKEINLIPAAGDELRVIIYASRREVTLAQFPHKPLWKRGKTVRRRAAGVLVNVGKGWTELHKGAFIVGGGRAKGHIAERPDPPRNATKGPRKGDPILFDVRFGPSPHQMMRQTLPDLAADAERDLEREIRRQLSRKDL